jgi:HSP20 family molecular chaperone IbpA
MSANAFPSLTWLQSSWLKPLLSRLPFRDVAGDRQQRPALWLAETKPEWVHAIETLETETELILRIRLDCETAQELQVQVTRELLVVRWFPSGAQTPPTYRTLELLQGEWEALIPLPWVVYPDSAWTAFCDRILTVGILKASEYREGVTLQAVEDCTLPLPRIV